MLLIFRVVANLDRSHACRHKIYKKNITFSDRKDAVRRTKRQPPYRPCVKANISECLTDVCFTSETGHWLNALGCPFCASFRLMHCSNKVLFDHLVGECEQIGRNGNAQGFGMEVDFQLKYVLRCSEERRFF